MSLSNPLLCRMLVVLLLFYLSKASGGTCLSYGHSCWGVPFFIFFFANSAFYTSDNATNYSLNRHHLKGTLECRPFPLMNYKRHGKRSGNAHIIEPFSQKHTSDWYISKLLDSPMGDSNNIEEIFKTQNLDSEEGDNFNRSGYQLYPEPDTEKNNVRSEKENPEAGSGQNKWNSEADEPEEEIIILAPKVHREPISKFRLYEIMFGARKHNFKKTKEENASLRNQRLELLNQ